VIMNARYGWGIQYSTDGPSQRFHREFWDAVFGEDISVVGRVNHDSKEDNLWRINYACMRWCYYQLNLFGDPTLDLIPSEPEPEPVIAIDSITAGGFTSINAEIKNIGFWNATDIVWNISVHGGILGWINIEDTGNLSLLEIGEMQTVKTETRIFGLGNIAINVSASAPYADPVSKTAKGFVLGPFVLKVIMEEK